MSNVPSDLRYTSTHEWVRVEEDNTVVVGITDHAQEAMGDLVYVETPDLDHELSAGEDAGVVESVKAASDIYAPIAGMVVAVNEELQDSPELANSDPYGDGWMFKLKITSTEEVDELLSADDYLAQLDDE